MDSLVSETVGKKGKKKTKPKTHLPHMSHIAPIASLYIITHFFLVIFWKTNVT